MTHGAEMIIADTANSGSNGRLELLGSQASFHIGQLNNVDGGVTGVRETIRWQADGGGITPIVVTGTGALTSNRVRLQSPAEAAADTGAGSTLTGDGVSLELDLSANTARTLTLIDNRTADPILGFFENGTTNHLYAEGATILGTGFHGSVRISYVGGTGNDVVLQMFAPLVGDFNNDGKVDAADYVVWRKTDPASIQGYLDWRSNFGATAGSGQSLAAAVPEPSAFVFAIVVGSVIFAGPLTRCRQSVLRTE